jgi:NHL repeat
MTFALPAFIVRFVLAATCAVVASCGGGGGGGGGAPPPAVAPAITLQPVAISVTVGQAANFVVAASGTAPLTYQWQRNGADIPGATNTTYAIAATTLADNGAAFRAAVTNSVGTATSDPAALSVLAALPVLTITLQPADTSVTTGAAAAFTVAATCSSGTLSIQWQRSPGAGSAFLDIAGAAAATYNLATTTGDSGAQFRAALACSGLSATTSNAALLTVTAASMVTLNAVPIVGLREQALLGDMTGIDQQPDGSFIFVSNVAGSVKRLSADFSTVTTVSGNGSAGGGPVDGPAASASFAFPIGVTHDAAGNLYVTDINTIRRIAPDGTVSTLAGLAGSAGSADGTGSAARFAFLHGIAMGPDGDLYVADQSASTIRRVTTAGVVTTYTGFAQDPRYIDGAASVARFSSPAGIAVAANGDVFVGDTGNNRIRRIRRSGSGAGNVDTLAGDGSATSRDGIGLAASTEQPFHVAVRGNTLTWRELFGEIRQIDLTTAAVTTLTGTRGAPEDYADGTKTTARLYYGFGLTAVASGGFMTADRTALRYVGTTGDVRSVAAGGAIGATLQGTGTLPQMPFASPQGIAVDGAGNIVIADRIAKQVRRISPSGAVTLAAGLFNSSGVGVDGTGSEAQFIDVSALASDSTGAVFAADRNGVRRIGNDNVTTTVAGSLFNAGAVDGSATVARFNTVASVAAATGGTLFVSDAINRTVRRIDAAGNVSTYAGVAGQIAIVDGPIATARFEAPGTIAVAPDGSVYVGENAAHTIRRIAPGGASVSTLAGVALEGSFTIDAAGTLYYGSPSGLMMLPLGGATSVVIPRGAGNVITLGAHPTIAAVEAVAVYGPKQLVLLSGGGQILKVALP